MGFSASPTIIIGIEASEIINVKVETETYDIHDQKGNKTGKVGTDNIIVLSAKVNGKDVIKREEKLYSDSAAELLGLIDSPNDKSFGVINTVYDGKQDVEKCIVGIPLVSIDIMYGQSIGSVSPVELSDAISEVKSKCKDMFEKDIEPKIFIYGNSSY